MKEAIKNNLLWSIEQEAENVFIQDLTKEEDIYYFNGKTSEITLPSDLLSFDEFTFSADILIESKSGDAPGGIVSSYDSKLRRGFMLDIKNNTGGPYHSSSRSHLHFGIDYGSTPKWNYMGQPGGNRFITSLATHEGHLYATIFDHAEDHLGHVYRYDQNGHWIDFGAPDQRNSCASLLSLGGKLYCTTQNHDPHVGHSALIDKSPNNTDGSAVYVYDGQLEWKCLGNPFKDSDAPGTMLTLGVYKNQLYAKDIFNPNFYLYDEGTWHEYPTQNWAITTMVEFNGELFLIPKKLRAPYYHDVQYEKKAGRSAMRYDFEKKEVVYSGIGASGQTYAFAKHNSQIFVGNWPRAEVFRSIDGNNNWTSCGGCGLGPMEGKISGETMGMCSYNGQFYIGNLPHSDLYRYDGDQLWTKIPRKQRDTHIPVKRLWCMEEYNGQLICGTLPFGEVWGLDAGISTSPNAELTEGWNQITAVKKEDHLSLYNNGQLISKSNSFPTSTDIHTNLPITIGASPYDHFSGKMKNVSLYQGAIDANDLNPST